MMRLTKNIGSRAGVMLTGLGMLASACAPGPGAGNAADRKAKFDELLARGRRIQYGQSTPDQPSGVLSLAGTPQAIVFIETDVDTQKPVWILYNTDLNEGYAPDVLDAASVSFVRDNEGLIGVSADQLDLQAEKGQPNDLLTALTFRRHVNGVAVRDAKLRLIYSRGADSKWHLREVVNRSYGDIDIRNKGAVPTSSDELFELLGLDSFTVVGTRRLIFPKRLVGGAMEFVYASEFELAVSGDTRIVTVTVEDGSSTILETFSNQYHAQATLNAKVYNKNYLDGATMDKPLAFVRLRYDTNMTQVTSADGLFNLDQSKAVQVELSSPRVAVFNNTATAATVLSANLPATNASLAGATLDETRALNSFLSVHRVNRFARQFMKGADSSVLTTAIPLKYNVAGACNAYFTNQPYSLNIFAAGTTQGTNCANLAETNDVMYHEWGHALDFGAGVTKNAITDGAYSEGIGDITAMLIEADPILAQGFVVNSPNGIRNLAPTTAKVYPGSLQNEVHADGEIIGQTFWDLRKAMVARHGEVKGAYLTGWLFFKSLTDTDAYLDSYASVLRLDDDDGNAANKSPNHCLINAAYARHGLATLEANCTDTPPADGVPVASDLVTGVKSESTDGAILMVASTKADSIVACTAERAACLKQGGPQTIQFDKEGQAGGKVFFVAKTPIQLSELGPLTIVAKDIDGKIIGARAVRMVVK